MADADVVREALHIVDQRLGDARLLTTEYRSVVSLDARIDHTVYVSQQPEHASRNRYVNVLPYDYNLVSVGSERAYLNASFVRAEDRASGMEFNYICSQGPLPATVATFWLMVLEQRAPAIIMLTNLVERGAAKCARYFPDQPGETMRPGGGISVSVLQCSATSSGQMTERVLEVSCSSSSGSRGGGNGGSPPPPLLLRHYHYHAWPDHGTPANSLAIRDLCKVMQSIRQQQNTEVQQGVQAQRGVQHSQQPEHSSQEQEGGHTSVGAVPCSSSGRCQAVVHCSAGIGRTGTFLATDIMIQRIRRLAARAAASGSASSIRGRFLSEAFNIPTLVHELRQQRMGMVQTFDQYSYIYRALQEELHDQLAQMGVQA